MKPLLNLAERAVMTYLQALVGLLIVGDLTHASTYQAVMVAAIPAGLTVIANGLPLVPTGLSYAEDLILRVVRTYVATFLGLILAAPMFRIDVTFWRSAAIAALPAALAALKGGLAKTVGDPNTAALLPDTSTPSIQSVTTAAKTEGGMTSVEVLLVIVIVLLAVGLTIVVRGG